MKERRDSILKGFKTSGIHAKRDSGLYSRGIQERRMQERRYARKEE